MFKWKHQFSTTVNFPIEKVWDFLIDPKNWILRKELEAFFQVEEPIKKGTIVKAKLKNKRGAVHLIFTEVKPYKYFQTVVKIPLFKQESCYSFERQSLEETKIISTLAATSILTPFLKSYYLKNFEEQYNATLDKMIKTLLRQEQEQLTKLS